jgi:hypothetical protein
MEKKCEMNVIALLMVSQKTDLDILWDASDHKRRGKKEN